MPYFYSKTTRGFYVGKPMPEDAVQVTDAQHAKLMDAQTDGKVIVPDANGFPVAVDRNAA